MAMGLSETRFRLSCVACGSLALLAATLPARAADPPAEPPGEASGLVPVHLTSPVPVLLRRLAPGDDTFVDLCVSPCDIRVPRDGEYVVDDARDPPPRDQSGPIALAVAGVVVALAGIPVIAENAHAASP